jgi:hypothetical protein
MQSCICSTSDVVMVSQPKAITDVVLYRGSRS